MNEKKTKEEQVIRCLVEKETIPRNQVDLKLLRSNFERTLSNGSRSNQRQGLESGYSSFCGTHSGVVHGSAGSSGVACPGEDVVDHSQPSMAEVLVKFRQLERSRRPGTGSGRSKRCSSAEGRRTSDDFREAGLNRRSFELEDSEEHQTTPQISTLVAIFRQMEGKKPSRGSGKKPGTEQQRSSLVPKGSTLQKDREQGQKVTRSQGSQGGDEGEMEIPEEGTVQALLLQWKALEKPLTKKRKSWMEVQASRQSDQKKKQTTWTPKASQKTPSFNQKVLVSSQKSSGATKKTTVPSQKVSVTSQKITVTPPKTVSASQKTTVTHNKTAVVSKNTPSTAHTHKPDIQSGGVKNRSISSNDNWVLNGSLKNFQEPGTSDELPERSRTEKEQEDDHVTFDGIAKNMMEKFRQLERKYAPNDELDSVPRKKEYRWEVKSPATLGRPHASFGSTGAIVVTFEPATVTPTSFPESGHFDLRQPDLVEQSTATSIGWKSEREELPYPIQTKRLLAQFEVGKVHPLD